MPENRISQAGNSQS